MQMSCSCSNLHVHAQEPAEIEKRVTPDHGRIGDRRTAELTEKRLEDLRAGRAVPELRAGMVGLAMDGPLWWTLSANDELLPD
jgi:hypothetical protein